MNKEEQKQQRVEIRSPKTSDTINYKIYNMK